MGNIVLYVRYFHFYIIVDYVLQPCLPEMSMDPFSEIPPPTRQISDPT